MTTSVWTPLREPIFRALLIASIASNIGTWMQNVGATWLMTSLAPAPIMLALVQAASYLPIFILSVPAGAIADLLDRRKVLIFSQIWMLMAAGILAVTTWMGITTAWTVIGMTFMLGLGAALNGPAWQAIIPEMVSPAELLPGVALVSASFNIARAVGPAIGGWFVAAAGPAANFFLNAVSFLAVIVVLYRWERPKTVYLGPKEEMIGAMMAGLRFIRHSPAIHRILFHVLTFSFAASAIWALLPVVAHDMFHGTAMTYGTLLGCLGAGAVLGAVILRRLQSFSSTQMLLAWMTFVFALASATLGLARWIVLDYLLLFAAGIAWLVILSAMNTAVQVSTPTWVRARAMSIYLLVFYCGMSAGSAIWGGIATKWGTPFSLFVAAICLAIAAVFMGFYPILEKSHDLTPSRFFPEPETSLKIAPEHGPVLVTVDYRIDPAQARDFALFMHQIKLLRRRDGAMRWGLYRDSEDPNRYVEIFRVASWGEHLRQHERVTNEDRILLDQASSFHTGAEAPVVTHLISAGDPWRL